MNYKEFIYNKNKELLESFGVTDFTDDNVRYICEDGKAENIKLLEGQDFTDDNIKYICYYGNEEDIKEYIKKYLSDKYLREKLYENKYTKMGFVFEKDLNEMYCGEVCFYDLDLDLDYPFTSLHKELKSDI